jgi:pimeloyl-ACP methyl ester carboxylesterase
MTFVLVATAACSGVPSQAPQPPQRHTVTVDGHPVAVWEKRPAAPTGTVLLIHGRIWSGVPDFDLQVPGEQLSLMDRLVAAGYAVYAQDLRGYGGTPRDSTDWATPDRSVADVAAVLRWIGEQLDAPGLPALFGWSYGSMVSHLTAQRHGDLISALVLYGYPLDPDGELPILADTAAPERRRNTEEAAASDFITPGTISDLAVRVYVEASLAADSIRTDWRRVHEFSAIDAADVPVPTLVIHGEFDPFAPVASQARLFARLGHPDRRWVVVPNADHAAHLEHPARFLRELVGFLERDGR